MIFVFVLYRYKSGLKKLSVIANVQMIDFVCTFCFFVSQIEKNKSRCFVRFEDQSEYWILFKDLQKGMVLQNIKRLVILQIRM